MIPTVIADTTNNAHNSMSSNDSSILPSDQRNSDFNQHKNQTSELNSLPLEAPIVYGKSLNRCSTTGSLSLRSFGQKLRRLLPLGGASEYEQVHHLEVPRHNPRCGVQTKMRKDCKQSSLDFAISGSSSECGSSCSEMDMSSTGSSCSRSNNTGNGDKAFVVNNLTHEHACERYCFCNESSIKKSAGERRGSSKEFQQSRKHGPRKTSLTSLVGIKRLLRRTNSNPSKNIEVNDKSIVVESSRKEEIGIKTQTSCNFTLSSSSDEDEESGTGVEAGSGTDSGDEVLGISRNTRRRRYESAGTFGDELSCPGSSGFYEDTTLSTTNNSSCNVSEAIGTCGELSTYIGVGRTIENISRDTHNNRLEKEGGNEDSSERLYQKSSNACTKRSPSYKAANRKDSSRPLTRSMSAVTDHVTIPVHANFLRYSNVRSATDLLISPSVDTQSSRCCEQTSHAKPVVLQRQHLSLGSIDTSSASPHHHPTHRHHPAHHRHHAYNMSTSSGNEELDETISPSIATRGQCQTAKANGGKSKKKSLAKDVKEKLSFLRRRHTDTALSGRDKVKTTPSDVLLWSRSFENLLHDKQGLELFRIFLQTEFSEENIEFWISCERFRDVTGSGKQIEEAHRIYTDFVAVQAPHEINLDSNTRQVTMESLDRPERLMFEEAQRRIQALMEKDSYRRFLRSTQYLDLLGNLRSQFSPP